MELQDSEDDGVIREIVEQFLGEVPFYLQDMDLALEARNWRRVSEVAHSLKGSAATFGLVRAGEVAFRIEQAARSPEPVISEALHESVRGALMEGRHALQAYLHAA